MRIQLKFDKREQSFPSPYDDGEAISYSYTGKLTWNQKEYKYTRFMWYYKENPGVGCFGLFPKSRAMGYHPHDIEGVTILYDKEEPCHVYFHAHGYGQGTLVKWEYCEKTADGALVVYVAKYSHASYPKPGVYRRVLGIASDVAKGDGKQITYGDYADIPATITLTDGQTRKVDLQKIPTMSAPSQWLFCLPFTIAKLRKL
jgi:hypothetical protein